MYCIVPLEIAASADINEFWDNWKALFLSAVKDHIPIKIVRDTNSPPWIDSEVRLWIRKKYTALKKFRLNKTPERKLKLRTLSHTVKVLVRIACTQARWELNINDTWRYCASHGTLVPLHLPLLGFSFFSFLFFVLYYKFILYITSGVPNKAVEKIRKKKNKTSWLNTGALIYDKNRYNSKQSSILSVH